MSSMKFEPLLPDTFAQIQPSPFRSVFDCCDALTSA
jgi:hypothetical protein